MGIGIWPNDDGSIDLYYETWEESIILTKAIINHLHRCNFKYTCIDYTDNEWDIFELELKPRSNESLPIFNYIEHGERIDSFSCVIIGDCVHDIKYQK